METTTIGEQSKNTTNWVNAPAALICVFFEHKVNFISLVM